MKKYVITPIILILVISPILSEIIMKMSFLIGWDNFLFICGLIIAFGLLILKFSASEIWHYTRYEQPEDNKIYIVKTSDGYFSYGIWLENIKKWKISIVINKNTTLKEMGFYNYKPLYDVVKYTEIENF